MKYRDYNNLIWRNKIQYRVRKASDNALPHILVHDWVDIRITANELDTSFHRPNKFQTQTPDALLIPLVGLL